MRERSEAFTRHRGDNRERSKAEKKKADWASVSHHGKEAAAASKELTATAVAPARKQPPIGKTKEALEIEIQKKKKVMGTIKLETLPDRGRRLKDQLRELEEQLSFLSLSPAARCDVTNPPSSKQNLAAASGKPRDAVEVVHAPLSSTEKVAKEVQGQISSSKVHPKTGTTAEMNNSEERRLSKEPRGGGGASGTVDFKTKVASTVADSRRHSKGESESLRKSDAAVEHATPDSASFYGGWRESTSADREVDEEDGPDEWWYSSCASETAAEPFNSQGEDSQSSSAQRKGVPQRRPSSPVAGVVSRYEEEPRPPTTALHSVYERRVQLVSPQPLPRGVLSPTRGKRAESLGTRLPAGLSASCTSRLQHFLESVEKVPGEWEESPQPEGVRTPLMPHQRQALRWMLWREEGGQEAQGGILADAMGLGKTLTMLALIAEQRASDEAFKAATTPPRGSLKKDGEEGGGRGHRVESVGGGTVGVCGGATLVVCPLSLLHQWAGEVERHLPGGALTVHVHHGRTRSADPRELAGCHLVVTTYDTISSDWARVDATGDKQLSPLFSLRWRRLVLDEAHSIRNLHTRRAKAACALRAEARWALTGTPVHNDLGDMRALLKFLQCRPFDDDAFWKQWIKENPGIEALSLVMKCVLLRRTKEQTGRDGKPLVPLPTKSIVLHKLSLEGTEAKVYKQLDQWSRSSGPEKYVDPVSGKELYRNTGSRRFVMLIRLQQACSHLSLLKGKVLEDAAVDTDELLSVSLSGLQLADVPASGEDRLDALRLQEYAGAREFDAAHVSCKIKALMDMLLKIQQESNNQDKSVVVSRWTSLLSLVQRQLERRGIPCVSIQGSVPGQQRAAHVQSFNRPGGGPMVMLLSLEAGGVGLNLVGGNHMFVLDVHWNPALEAQAFDRIHRVGQTKPVVINRLVCAGTIEERILELQKHKQQLAEAVVGRRRLTPEDYHFLFATSP